LIIKVNVRSKKYIYREKFYVHDINKRLHICHSASIQQCVKQKTMLISYVFTFECSTSSIICIWGGMRGMGGMGGMGGRE
jgi:hypothetical protein